MKRVYKDGGESGKERVIQRDENGYQLDYETTGEYIRLDFNTQGFRAGEGALSEMTRWGPVKTEEWTEDAGGGRNG